LRTRAAAKFCKSDGLLLIRIGPKGDEGAVAGSHFQGVNECLMRGHATFYYTTSRVLVTRSQAHYYGLLVLGESLRSCDSTLSIASGEALSRYIAYALALLVCTAILARVRSSKIRQAVLLAASYALYMSWSPWFAAVLLLSTAMNYFLGTLLRRKQSGFTLTAGILLNIALLSVFKYLPAAAIHLPFSSLQKFSQLALPLGISFWSFQAMSYLFDIYQGEELDPSLAEFALYMVFFPVTISGPVCRMPEMLPQFRSDGALRWADVLRGFQRIATGIFMMQVAKLLGQGILGGDGIASGFDRSTQWSGADVWCLAFGYGLQLFFDFAGYSHIAIGAAKMMGFTIPENFARPFHSTSASMFWTRWHMSLSFWIRDYVFFPLMQLHRGVWWRSVAIVASMILFGLWHGATILFLVWGCYHGVLLVLHRVVEGLERKYDWTPPDGPWTLISWIATISLVSLGWIFFRANSAPEAKQMLVAALSPATYLTHFLSSSLYGLVSTVAAVYAFVVWAVEALNIYTPQPETSSHAPGFLPFMARWRWFWIPSLYVLGLFFLWIVTLTQRAGTAQFMYRRF